MKHDDLIEAVIGMNLYQLTLISSISPQDYVTILCLKRKSIE